MWLEFFPVRYLEDENCRLQDVLQGEFPRSGYPELEFKRNNFQHEKEARFVLHDHSATIEPLGAHGLLVVARPKRFYAAFDPNKFIEAIYPLNDVTSVEVNNLLAPLAAFHQQLGQLIAGLKAGGADKVPATKRDVKH